MSTISYCSTCGAQNGIFCICFMSPFLRIKFVCWRFVWFFVEKIILRWKKLGCCHFKFSKVCLCNHNCKTSIIALYIILQPMSLNNHILNDIHTPRTVRSLGAKIFLWHPCIFIWKHHFKLFISQIDTSKKN